MVFAEGIWRRFLGLSALFMSTAAVKSSKTLGSLESSVVWPIHDAIIASGILQASGRLSLSDMLSVLNCSTNAAELEAFVGAIPLIIEKALKRAERDHGRIIEHTNYTLAQIGDNYNAKIKAVTMSCVSLYPIIDENKNTHIGPASYATRLITSPSDPRDLFDSIIPDKNDARIYNLSMIMESNVIELPAGNLLYVPVKHCLDFEEDNESGKENSFDNTLTIPATANHVRSISVGTKTTTFPSYMNRVTLRTTLANDTQNNLIKNAFESPKAELLAVIEVIERGICKNQTTNEDKIKCVILGTKSVIEEDGLMWDQVAAEVAVVQYGYMISILDTWNDWKLQYQNLGVMDVPGNGQFQELLQAMKDSTFRIFPAPWIYERSIAWGPKNSAYLILPVQANPYYSKEIALERIATSADSGNNLIECVAASSEGDTSAARASAMFIKGAIKRRIHEHVGSPQTQLQNWTIYDEKNELFKLTHSFNSKYLTQHTKWKNDLWLENGNLTEKILGRSARWLMMSPSNLMEPEFSDGLKDLVEEQQNSIVYSKAASEAVVVGHPCSKAVSDADIFLFVLGMATAACGGVNAIVIAIHYAMNWWAGACCFPSKSRSIHGWRRFLPTYELFLVASGTVVFFAFYTPLIFQILDEVEVSNFHSSSVNAEVLYAPYSVQVQSGSRSTFVTFVQVETNCASARPNVLMSLLVVGWVLGVLLNAPYIHRARDAILRYWRRIRSWEEMLPDSCTIHEQQLTILAPYSAVDWHEAGNFGRRMWLIFCCKCSDLRKSNSISLGKESDLHMTHGGTTCDDSSPVVEEVRVSPQIIAENFPNNIGDNFGSTDQGVGTSNQTSCSAHANLAMNEEAVLTLTPQSGWNHRNDGSDKSERNQVLSRLNCPEVSGNKETLSTKQNEEEILFVPSDTLPKPVLEVNVELQ